VKIKFCCPKCGCKVIEEVMANVTVASDIQDETLYDGRYLELGYGEQTNDGGEVDRYQCKNCGYTIAVTNRDLFAFLCQHDMIEADPEDGEVLPVKVIHCGCCECYHRVDFHGDCREDTERFADLDAAKERFGEPILEMFPDGSRGLLYP